MRVLLATQLYSPFVSGSARLLQDIVEHLHAQGHAVEVLTLDLATAGDVRRFDERQPYRIHRVKPWPIKGGSSAAMTARLFLLCASGRFDIVLCGFASPIAILANVVSRLTRVPYAVYTHGEDVIAARTEARRGVLAAALKRACVVMSNSQFSAGEVEWFGVPPARIRTISPGIDPAPYLAVSPSDVEALRTRFGLAGKRIVFTLARLDSRKGHDMVVRSLPAVAAAVPDVHYLIVGKGDPERLRSLAAEAGVGDRVTIADYLPNESLPVVFSLCDVHIMPSRFDPQTRQVEGFGIVYLEAAACGKPSVAGNQGGCADAVSDGVTGILVDPTDVAAIGDALVRLLRNDVEARQMGAAGRERVCREFDKFTQLRAIEDTLAQCLGRPSRPSMEG